MRRALRKTGQFPIEESWFTIEESWFPIEECWGSQGSAQLRCSPLPTWHGAFKSVNNRISSQSIMHFYHSCLHSSAIAYLVHVHAVEPDLVHDLDHRITHHPMPIRCVGAHNSACNSIEVLQVRAEWDGGGGFSGHGLLALQNSSFEIQMFLVFNTQFLVINNKIHHLYSQQLGTSDWRY